MLIHAHISKRLFKSLSLAWLTSPSMILSRSIHVLANYIISSIITNIPCVYKSYILYPLICFWILGCFQIMSIVNRDGALEETILFFKWAGTIDIPRSSECRLLPPHPILHQQCSLVKCASLTNTIWQLIVVLICDFLLISDAELCIFHILLTIFMSS